MVKFIASPVEVEYKRVDPKRISSNAKYQRPVYGLREFREIDYEPIVLNFRDNVYYLMDGQNRLTAYRESGMTDPLMCKVLMGLTYEDEAKMCAQVDEKRKKMVALQKAKALLEAKDENMVKINNCVESTGLKISFNGESGEGKILAIADIIQIYNKMGEQGLIYILSTIVEIWHGRPDSLQGRIISGMSKFKQVYKDNYIHKILINQLKLTTPEEIILAAKMNNSKTNSGSKHARVIAEKYNKRQTHKLDISILDKNISALDK